MPKVTAKQKYWSEQLTKANAFKGSLTQYAQAQNIPVQTLYYSQLFQTICGRA